MARLPLAPPLTVKAKTPQHSSQTYHRFLAIVGHGPRNPPPQPGRNRTQLWGRTRPFRYQWHRRLKLVGLQPSFPVQEQQQRLCLCLYRGPVNHVIWPACQLWLPQRRGHVCHSSMCERIGKHHQPNSRCLLGRICKVFPFWVLCVHLDFVPWVRLWPCP